MKNDGRDGRNHLLGVNGDEMYALMMGMDLTSEKY
jgi:hypothetical protein